MHRCLLFLFLLSLVATPALAQRGPVRFGLFNHDGIKYPFMGRGGQRYHLYGQVGFGGSVVLPGADEYALSLLLPLSFADERISYHADNIATYTIHSYDVVFSPTLVIPTRKPALQGLAGIGVDWAAYEDLWVSSNGGATSTNTIFNVDAAYDTITAARRRLIPFVSAGVQLTIRTHVRLQLTLRQDLRDSFPDNTNITFGGGSAATFRTQLSHQPTRLVFAVHYML